MKHKKNRRTYSVTEIPAIKVTVMISRKQMWENFVNCWQSAAWCEYHGIDLLKDVADVLLCGENVSVVKNDIRRLFKDGNTVLFMGKAMDKLDVSMNINILREIIVQDVNDVTGEVEDYITIYHEDIVF